MSSVKTPSASDKPEIPLESLESLEISPASHKPEIPLEVLQAHVGGCETGMVSCSVLRNFRAVLKGEPIGSYVVIPQGNQHLMCSNDFPHTHILYLFVDSDRELKTAAISHNA
jgi:hypothetical protein